MGKPKIRFKGYTTDWEQRKFSDVAEYRNGKAHENEIDDDGEYIVVNSKFVSTNGEIKKFSNAQNEPLYENEIAFVLSDVPNGRAIARTFLIDKSGKYTLNQRIAGITPHEDTDPYYLHIKMNRNAYFLKFDDGNKQTNLSIKDVLNYEDMYPNYKEQQKIGNYFRSLDHLITLHQRKYEEMKTLKKYMLQKMFPQSEQKVPEIRFAGFTKAWEQRKFADFTWDAGKRNKEDLDLEPYAITNEHGFIRQRDAHDDFGYMKDTDRKAYNIVQPNSFAYNPARINVGSIGYYKGVENVIVSSLYEVFQTDNYVNDRFLWHWLKSDEFPRWIEKLQEGSVRLYFYYDKLCECQLYMPSLEEQEKIASFLDGLDHLITLHQRKY